MKPACRFRQARGLRRGSEYGSSVQSTDPAGSLRSPAGFSFLLPMAAGSVSELKPSETNATPDGVPRRRSLLLPLRPRRRPFRSHSLRDKRERNGRRRLCFLMCLDIFSGAVSGHRSLFCFNPGPLRSQTPASVGCVTPSSLCDYSISQTRFWVSAFHHRPANIKRGGLMKRIRILGIGNAVLGSMPIGRRLLI